MRDVSYAGFYWQPWKGVLKRLWWLVRYFPASLQTFQGGKHWRGSVGTLLSHLAVPFKLWRMGFRGRFYFVDHHLAHAASAFLVSPYESAAILTVDLCGEDCTTLLARGSGQPHPAAPPLLSAALARHLLRSAHAVPGIPGQRRRIQGDGARVLRPPATCRHVCADGAVRERPAAERQFVVRLSHRWRPTATRLGSSRRSVRHARTNSHVDADHYKDLAASGQKRARGAHPADGCVVPEGNRRGTSVHGGRRGAEFRRQRTPARPADLHRHLGPARRRATLAVRSASPSTSGTSGSAIRAAS